MAVKAYSSAGNFTITLTVSDDYENDPQSTIKTTYILIKVKPEENTPGFEIISILLALVIISILMKKRKRNCKR